MFIKYANRVIVLMVDVEEYLHELAGKTIDHETISIYAGGSIAMAR